VRWIWDGRTLDEFRQGSVVGALNLPLADVRWWLLAQVVRPEPSGGPPTLSKALRAAPCFYMRQWESRALSFGASFTPNTVSVPSWGVDVAALAKIAAALPAYISVRTAKPSIASDSTPRAPPRAAVALAQTLQSATAPNDEKLDALRCLLQSAGAATQAAAFELDVLLYCASGYRTRIAQSVFQHLFRAPHEAPPSAAGEAASADDASEFEPLSIHRCRQVVDVPGGAIELMTHHAHRWEVKDRSIVCVS
jgi:rhodanese-related sulfurtransferase